MVCGMQKLYLVYKISGGYLYTLVVSELGAAICKEIAVRTPLLPREPEDWDMVDRLREK